jgi:hypothetical protein
MTEPRGLMGSLFKSNRRIWVKTTVSQSRHSNVLRVENKSALPDLNGGQVDLQSTALPD